MIDHRPHVPEVDAPHHPKLALPHPHSLPPPPEAGAEAEGVPGGQYLVDPSLAGVVAFAVSTVHWPLVPLALGALFSSPSSPSPSSLVLIFLVLLVLVLFLFPFLVPPSSSPSWPVILAIPAVPAFLGGPTIGLDTRRKMPASPGAGTAAPCTPPLPSSPLGFRSAPSVVGGHEVVERART